MLTVKITEDTFAKQSTQPSETLSPKQKQFIKAGEELKIKSYIKQKKDYLVRLQDSLVSLGKSAFLLEKHIQISLFKKVL